MRRRATGWFVSLAGLGMAALAVWAQDQSQDKRHEEKTVSTQAELLAELPAPAIATLMHVSSYSRIDSIETVTQGDTRMFIATWRQDGTVHDASISQDGVLLETNEQLELARVPEAVQKTATEFFPPGSELEYGRKMMVVYTARGPFKGHGQQILVTPTGELADDGRGTPEEEEGLDGATTQPSTPASPGVPTTAPAGTRG